MKQYIIIFLAIISTSLFVGCSSDDDLVRPDFVSFEGVEQGKSVTVVENSSASVDVTVYAGTTSGSERTFDLNVLSSSTLNAESYSLPSSITIPGGSNEASFTVDFSDNNLAATGGTLAIDLEGDTPTGDPLEIVVSKFCPLNVDEFLGSYTGTGSWSEIFGYTTEVEIFRNEDGELMINGLVFQWIEGWWGETIVTNEPVMMEVNPETGAINIPEQFYVETTWDGALQPAYNIKGSGTMNACTGVVTIRPVLVQGGEDIDPVSFGGVPFLETITLDTSEPGEGEEEEGEEEEGEEEEGEEAAE